MPGPAIQPGPSTAGRAAARRPLVDQQHHLEVGRQPLDPASARPTRSSSPAPASPGPAQPNVVEQLDQPPLDQAGVAGRVLGLDRQVDRAVVVGARSPAAGAGSAPCRGRGSTVGSLVVELGPRVLPGREVQLVELGELHRGDHPAACCAGTPQVAVVDADQVPVGGRAGRRTRGLGALVQGGEVGAQGVLGVVVAGPPVRDDLRRPSTWCMRPSWHPAPPVHARPGPARLAATAPACYREPGQGGASSVRRRGRRREQQRLTARRPAPRARRRATRG